MPTNKIRDLDRQEMCVHPDHLPPLHKILPPGVYEHICEGCGRTIEFIAKGHHWTSYELPATLKGSH